jgi:excisionase family DNA binding protein
VSAAKAAEAEDIMTAGQVAEMLGLSLKTVYESAARGRIPCRRVGRRCLFFRPAIVAWLEQGRVGSRAA